MHEIVFKIIVKVALDAPCWSVKVYVIQMQGPTPEPISRMNTEKVKKHQERPQLILSIKFKYRSLFFKDEDHGVITFVSGNHKGESG